ncbi:hypothetical protein ACFOLJ_20855 [Rugamonas sp. CCM 8940]|uniref:hypothetical protein n=1 Tax=Rugamonas sp. CCM 8940 TaxID=2765359 RepID=UPI0018F3BE64|nr:hypothetical protein [Rugamonas sp. CCM 8940]MBJ7312224.1 hypothetical protein [Rugamonas sp. CCM 8940]
MKSKSYIVGILRLLAGLDGRPVALPELARRLLAGEGEPGKLPVTRARDDQFEREAIHALERKLAPLMQELADLKVIWLNDGVVALGAAPPGNQPPGPPDGGAGDGDGGSGLGEVLAHPILFAYSEEDLDLTLDAALEEFE